MRHTIIVFKITTILYNLRTYNIALILPLYTYNYSGPPPYEESDCKDTCQLTFCEACYYSNDTLPTPPRCVDPSVDDDNCMGCLCCLKEWARCVEIKNERDNEVQHYFILTIPVHYLFYLYTVHWKLRNSRQFQMLWVSSMRFVIWI